MIKSWIVRFSVAFLILSFNSVSFAKEDKEKEKSMPPGLQKKADRGQELPPGWQKKLVVGDILDEDVYDRGIVVTEDKNGLVTLKLDGKLVRLIQDTREIVDILKGK